MYRKTPDKKVGRILYLSALKKLYSRDQILRMALEDLGFEVVLFPQLREKILVNAVMDTLKYLRGGMKCSPIDAVVLGCFSHSLFLFAWFISKWMHVPLVADFFVSRYESYLDRRPQQISCAKKRMYYLEDRIIFHVSDVIITDTQTHLNKYQELYGSRKNRNNYVFPVGATDVYRPKFSKGEKHRTVDILFWGSFIPLHGIDVILETAKLLMGRETISFTVIGSGQTYAKMWKLKENLGLTNVQMSGEWLPENVLVERIQRADIALGIFGTSQKAECVIPNKVYQAMACGIPVITMISPAIKEYDGLVDVITTCDNTPLALAEKIQILAGDLALRIAMAKKALIYYHSHFSREGRARSLRKLRQYILKP